MDSHATPRDFAYLVVSSLATWWTMEEMKGNNPRIKVTWATIRFLRKLDLVILKTEKLLCEYCDHLLDGVN